MTGNSTTNSVGQGAGIYSYDYDSNGITLVNSIVIGNSNSTGRAEIYLDGGGGSLTTVGGNILGQDVLNGNSTVGSTTAEDTFAQVALVNGIYAGVLADNGGPVDTVALNRIVGNDAIDASDTNGEVKDARGNDAINIPGLRGETGNEIRDLGAYEAGLEPSSLHVTTTNDVINPLDDVTSLREAHA